MEGSDDEAYVMGVVALYHNIYYKHLENGLLQKHFRYLRCMKHGCDLEPRANCCLRFQGIAEITVYQRLTE